MAPVQKRKTGKKSITLRDVVVHMQSMEQRLSAKIEANTKGIDANTKSIKELDQRLSGRIDKLTNQIKALDEDLTATIKDTITIRRHVGMAVAED